MLRPKSYITITSPTDEVVFDFVHRMEINKSFEHLTDTAEITLPRKLTQSGKNVFAGANPIFKRGDKIKIEAGYLPNRETIFEGFIKQVSAKIPVHILCEDYMYLMKQYKVTYPTTVTYSYFSKSGKPLKHPKPISDKINLSDLLDYIFYFGNLNDLLDGIDYKIVSDIDLGMLRYSNITPAQILDDLRDRAGLYSYFVNKTLHVGFAFDALRTNEATFPMEEVCINSNDLDYQNAEDVRVKIKCISMLENNTKLEAEAGDTDGEQRTIHLYNVTNEADLKKQCEDWVKQHKYTGFKGYFETFGEPHMESGDRAVITSNVLPERNGTYLIKSNRIVFGVTEGYKQSLELAYKLL